MHRHGEGLNQCSFLVRQARRQLVDPRLISNKISGEGPLALPVLDARIDAEIVFTAPTKVAFPTDHDRLQRHPIAFFHFGDVLADLQDFPG